MAVKKESKTIWITLDTKLYYSQLFESNRDTADMHSETDGVTKVTLRLEDDQIQNMIDLGVPETALGYQTFKDVTIDGENFRAYIAKRPWKSKYLKDDNGEQQFMGAPKVFDYWKAKDNWEKAGSVGRITDEHKEPWAGGLIGNGSEAKVKLSIYRGKNKAGKPTCVVTLEEVAITNHVPYEGGAQTDDNGEVRF